MIKVVIADDEYRICELIHRLVDWQSLDMEVVAMANDGVEALQIIKEYLPDILITDIRMPGLGGLELIEQASRIAPDIGFIIISGYSEFEYAKKALSFAVVDYLLKPINKEELRLSLEKFCEIYENRKKDLRREKELAQLTKRDEQNVRKQFLTQLQQSHGSADVSLLNENYHYHFQEDDYLQIVAIKASSPGTPEKIEDSFVYQKIEQIVRFEVQNLISDIDGVIADYNTYVFMVGYREQPAKMMKVYRKVLGRILLQKDILKNVDFCMGVGCASLNGQKLHDSLTQALLAIQQRIVTGPNHLIEGEKIQSVTRGYPELFTSFLADFEKNTAMLNEEEIKSLLMDFRRNLKADSSMNGHEIVQMIKGICNVFFLTLEKNGYHSSEREAYFTRMTEMTELLSSVDEILLYQAQDMIRYIRLVKESRRQAGIKPIRDAKEYIREHLAENITLEQISTMSGYNAAYFSTMFKKETGITISEYIIQTRMEKAKELLRLSNESVVSICEQVGYADVKSFTRNFKKSTGMKPSEYRKIYS